MPKVSEASNLLDGVSEPELASAIDNKLIPRMRSLLSDIEEAIADYNMGMLQTKAHTHAHAHTHTHTHTHTHNIAHAHRALHFKCRGALSSRRGVTRVAPPLPHHLVCVCVCVEKLT